MAERRPRLDQPKVERGPRLRIDAEAFGQLTEKIARFLGTGRYLVVQTVVVIAWVLWNTVGPKSLQFDPWNPTRFIFLTLILSLQASYAAPLILLAQNRQDDRDRVNLEADRRGPRIEGRSRVHGPRTGVDPMALGEVATRDFLRSELSRMEQVKERATVDE